MLVLVVYVLCVIVGQAVSVGIGLLLDPYSTTLALTVFIPLYYAMYWFAWRLALYLFDRSPNAEPASTGDKGGPGAAVASWLLVPAVLAVELCD
jgi:hypothetical protein